MIAGAKNEFRHLVAANQSYVFTLVLRQVGDREIARELTQEIFLRAYRGLGKFRFESRFATWITRIALNQSHSYFRSRRCKERRVEDTFEQAEHGAISLDTAEERLATAQEVQRLQQALRDLPEQQREVLVLCALEQKSYEEASEILSIPVGTVRSRLNRARHQLRARYFGEVA